MNNENDEQNNINTDNAIDVDYINLDDIIYISAVQMAKKVGTTESTIRLWFEYYGDLFGAKKGDTGRKLYKETEVKHYSFIKELSDKNMTKNQIREYISKHGFEFQDSSLVNPQEPLTYQALASAITVDVKEDLTNKFNDFADKILEQVSNKLTNHLESQTLVNYELKAEIEASVGEVVANIVESKLNQNKDNIVEELEGIIDEKEKEFTKKDNERIKMIREHQSELKKQYDAIQQSKNKGLFSWFKRG